MRQDGLELVGVEAAVGEDRRVPGRGPGAGRVGAAQVLEVLGARRFRVATHGGVKRVELDSAVRCVCVCVFEGGLLLKWRRAG